jgi:TonB-dependent receptor
MKNAETFKKKVTYLLKSRRANYRIYNGMLFKVGIITLMTVQLVMAAGTVKGRVFDKKSKEALPAANILVKGTNIGTAADLDGNYFLNYVPAGQQVLVVTYIGYEPVEVEVIVPEDGVVIQDLMLSPVAIKGEAVVITGQAASQGAAINQQISSNTITNIVSSSKIRELPDESAAAALSRLPGVSLMEGDKVAIRGVQAKQNLVLVNGVQLPSTDLEDRSTNLGFFSSNMLSGIEVIKVLTPDMDANAIGGVVNLRLREAPTGFQSDVFAQGSYNTQDRTYPGQNFKFWASASNRFFNDKLGVFIQGNAERSNVGNDITSAGYTRDAGTEPYGEGIYQLKDFVFIDEENIITNYGGSIFLDYKLPNGKIILQNALTHTLNDNAKYRLEYDLSINEIGYALNRDKHNKELLINALQANYNFGLVQAELGLSHSFSDKNTDIRYGDPGNEFGFQNVKSDVPFVDDNGNPIYYDVTRRFFTPEDVYKIKVKEDDWENAEIYGWFVTRDEAFKQHLYNGTLDFTVPVSFLNIISGDIKLGGKYTLSTRTNDVEESYRRTGAADFYIGIDSTWLGEQFNPATNPITFANLRNYDYESKRGKYFFEGDYPFQYALDKDLTDEFIEKLIYGWNHPWEFNPSLTKSINYRHKAKSLRDDFDGSEVFSAVYLMGDLNIGPRLSLIGGGRFEHFNMNYDANFVYVKHSVDGDANDTTRSVDRTDDTFFPNAQLRYKFTEWGDIRAAYSKSISRPDFLAILPNVYYPKSDDALAGNPGLKPSIATNYDVYLSLYSNKIGLFSLGGFYKEIDDVFFRTQVYYPHLSYYGVDFPDSAEMVNAGLGILPAALPGSSNKVTTYVNNPNPAYIKGLELEWQTYFWYLPKPFNVLVLSANYTRTWSDMDYLQIETKDTTITYIDPKTGKPRTRTEYQTIESVRKNTRLVGQADHLVNVALGVNYKGFAGRISFRLTDNMLSYVGIRPEEDEFTRTVTRWDISLKQKLPIKGLSIGFEGINIFHSPTETYKVFRRSSDTPIIENTATTQYEPRKFSLYLRYNFE